MTTRSFCIRLKPDRVQDYIEIHKRGTTWPEILTGLKDSGVEKMTTFLLDNTAIVTVEAENPDLAMRTFRQLPVHGRWRETTANMREPERALDARDSLNWLPCVFDFRSGVQFET